ncbi:MAG: ADP-glyceromanno-heptose 6-epimerase [Chlorobi bacterium]|nr:ADP-glyceromanno-heptose 6-epimerase [Chlorobiota bacterium]
MIVVTGGAGFIGSNLVAKLNEMGRDDIIIVDRLGTDEKWKNLNGLKFIFDKEEFYKAIIEETFPFGLDAIFHLGACSSTTETDADYLLQNNYRYSLELVKYALPRKTRFIYASSAATYGNGENGYDDKGDIGKLRPLNMYGYSKQMFDIWLRKMKIAEKVVGLKYFNVYGPNEYHKDEMRSVVHKAFEQIRDTGKVKLFKSYREEYKDGEQKRDFVYVDDAVDMTLYFMEHPETHGLFNVGTGKARTWNDLVTAVFKAMGKEPNIEYVEMPEDLRDQYQYFTEAKMGKMREAGYEKEIHSLEDGIEDYVKNYLLGKEYKAL